MAPKKSIGKGPGPRGLTDATKVKALLDESKIRPDALIPLQSGSALGPVYEGECSESLEDFYPGDPEHLPFHSIDPVWTEYFKGTPNRLWPKPNPEYNAWFLRVAEAKGAQWKRNGLYDIIFLSTQEIFLDKGLFYAAAQFWSTRTNSFHFPCGMMSPTIQEICMITGLPAHGKDADPFLELTEPPFEYPDDSKDRSYIAFPAYYACTTGKVSDREHIAFLIYWLNRYLFCVSSYSVTMDFTPLARALALDETYAMAPFVLAYLYRGMYHMLSKEFTFGCGPLWILMIWLWVYFPKFAPTSNKLPTHSCYGLNFTEVESSANTFAGCFSFFYTLESMKKGWMPFTRDTVPRNLLPLESSLDEETNGPEMWKSFLTARDLLYGLSAEAKNSKDGVEYYNPAQLARQFGLTQCVPVPPYQSLNANFGERPTFKLEDLALAKSTSFELKNKCQLMAYAEHPSKTKAFESWWKSYSSKAFAKPLQEVLLKIQPSKKSRSATTSAPSNPKRKGIYPFLYDNHPLYCPFFY